MEATCLPSGRRACVTLGVTGNPLVWSRGPGQIHRRLVNEAGDVSEDMEMGRRFHVPAPLFRKTGGNGTRHTCVSVPFLLFSSKFVRFHLFALMFMHSHMRALHNRGAAIHTKT